MTGTKNQVMNWFLTFSQYKKYGETGVTKETWETMWPPSSYSICCEEKHEDGGVHLHLVIRLLHGISKANLIDWAVAKLPGHYKRIDMKGCRSLAHSINYCMKEDPNAIVKGSLPKKKEKVVWSEATLMNDNMKYVMNQMAHDGWWTRFQYSNSVEWRRLTDPRAEALKFLRWNAEARWKSWLKKNGYLGTDNTG